MNVQDWSELIHSLPCAVCFHLTGERRFGVHGHHIESDRDELSDWLIVPLCPEHHDPQSPNSIHALGRRGFYTRYNMTEYTLIKVTLKLAMQALSDPAKVAILEAVATAGRAE